MNNARTMPRMGPDDDVCLCFRVPLRKLRAFLKRERPSVPSRLSECLGAGTGCHWCVPYLTRLHEQWAAGREPELDDVSPETYGTLRSAYRAQQRAGRKEPPAAEDATP